jgi:predicted HAD superfamily phosphohydrolase YqeG
VGDRLLTDILISNLNNSLSIYALPLDTSKEGFKVQWLRNYENKLLE